MLQQNTLQGFPKRLMVVLFDLLLPEAVRKLRVLVSLLAVVRRAYCNVPENDFFILSILFIFVSFSIVLLMLRCVYVHRRSQRRCRETASDREGSVAFYRSELTPSRGSPSCVSNVVAKVMMRSACVPYCQMQIGKETFIND